jgi:hypothetical protein
MDAKEVERAGLRFATGENVIIHGLKSERGKQLNSHIGELLSYDWRRDLWEVCLLRIAHQPKIKVGVENLRLWSWCGMLLKVKLEPLLFVPLKFFSFRFVGF